MLTPDLNGIAAELIRFQRPESTSPSGQHQQHLFSQIVEYFHENNGRRSQAARANEIWCPVLNLTPTIAPWDRRASIAPTVVHAAQHELGHALGFFGHIKPLVSTESSGPHDIMQEGFIPNRSYRRLESAPFPRLMVGIGSDSDLRDAVALIARENGEPRWHQLLPDGEDSSEGFTSWWGEHFDLYPPPPMVEKVSDGLPVLFEYAFGLDPTRADRQTLQAGVGIHGLPAIDVVGPPESRKLRIEFVRRSDPRLRYLSVVSTDLQNWTPVEAPMTTTPVSEDWDRVIVEADASGGPCQFGAVRVEIQDDGQ